MGRKKKQQKAPPIDQTLVQKHAANCSSPGADPGSSHELGSVTQWINDVRDYCDQDASRELYERYSTQLVRMLRARVNRKMQAVENAEDLAAFALSEVLCKLQLGALPDLSDRSGLWALMVSIADYRTRHVLRYVQQGKRDQDRTVHPDQIRAAQHDHSVVPGFDFSSREPTPELVASVNEQLEYLYNCLSSDEYRDLFAWELAGHSAVEMREKLTEKLGYHVTERTLRRKRAHMRKELQSAYGDDSFDETR